MREGAKKRDEDGRGVRCQQCGGRRFRVIYTRAAWEGKLVRRRDCRHCGKRMTTCERIIG